MVNDADRSAAGAGGARSPDELQASLQFIGTATTILRLGRFTLLTDPNFLHRGQRAYLGYGLFSKRLTEPAMGVQELPDLDAVVLSHLHADHFDGIARRQLSRDLPVMTTPAAAAKLRRWGFSGARGMRPWEVRRFERGAETLTITACPGQHGPRGVHRLLPPVMGSVIELRHGRAVRLRVYVTGDTLCRPYLREVSARVGAVDAMVLHLGGTRAMGVLVTMDGTQGADLVEMIAPRLAIPIHHDDYTVFRSPLSDFTSEMERRGLAARLRTVGAGEVVSLRPTG